MKTLQERQRQMIAWLNGTDDGIADHINQHNGIDNQLRLQIYQNAYRIRLRETLDTDHPQLGQYLGNSLYDALVDGYIYAHPSQFTSLRQFGDPLPAFLSQQPPFNGSPQIAELARFERLLLSAFDAADSPRAEYSALSDLPPLLWPTLTLNFHPSLQLFDTAWNVVEIWQALKAEQSPPDAIEAPQHWVLWRNRERLTEFCAISRIELDMLNAFLHGAILAEVAEFPAREMPEDEAGSYLLSTLTQWFDRGWIKQIVQEGETPALQLTRP